MNHRIIKSSVVAPAYTDTSSSSADSSTSSSTHSTPPDNDKEQRQARAQARREAAYAHFKQTVKWTSFLDPTQPWLLVENGSFLGFFDWVPVQYRVGPWSWQAVVYLTIVCSCTVWAGAYYYLVQDDSNTETSVAAPYPAPYSAPWMYQVVAFVWMNYINYLLISGPVGLGAWATYTVQSWTLMTVRHGLCVLAPFSSTATWLADRTRFPVACSATITFFVWNAVLFPIIYYLGMKTQRQRDNFVQFVTSFRMTNIHVLNIVLCGVNCGTWANPVGSTLTWFDLWVAAVSVLIYMMWYYGVLDRIGIHLYPVFSPRTGWFLLGPWTALIVLYIVTFLAWKYYLDLQVV